MSNYEKVNCNILHVGLSKCASSFFQRHVFTKENNYLLLRNKKHRLQIKKLRNGCITYDRKVFVDTFRNDIDVEEDVKIVVSHEGLSGFPENTLNLKYITEELGEVFDPEYVLLFIRHPLDYIYSIWSNYIRLGGSLCLRDYIYHASSSTRFNHQDSLLIRLDYATYIESLNRVFKNKVRVFALEDFLENPDLFFTSLSENCGIQVGKLNMNKKPQASLSLQANKVISHLNVFFNSKKCKTPFSLMPGHSKFRNFIEKNYSKKNNEKKNIRDYVVKTITDDDVEKINASVKKLELILDRNMDEYLV